jgi:hypothetical protein
MKAMKYVLEENQIKKLYIPYCGHGKKAKGW